MCLKSIHYNKIIWVLLWLPLFFLVNSNCKKEAKALPDPRFIVQIHDEPFLHSGKNVTELNITVERIDVIRSSDKKIITLSNTPRSMNILDIQANDPVVLSDVSVEPGWYEQLRLVLSEENTIVVDGQTHPITIPSGSQTGVKFRGPFFLEAGKFFRINLDFKAPESVLYTKGQGYKLKSVIEIVGTGTVLGIFRGKLSIQDSQTTNEVVVEIRDDQTFRMKDSTVSDYTFSGLYFYDSLTQVITFTTVSVTNPAMDQWLLDEILKSVPNPIRLKVVQWSLDEVIVIDIGGDQSSLAKVDSFSFSAGYTYTSVNVNVQYPDNSKNGKPVFFRLKFKNSSVEPFVGVSNMRGNSVTETIKVPSFKFSGDSTDCIIVAYLFDSTNDMNAEPILYGNELTADLSGAKIAASTHNPWAGEPVFTITKDQINNVNLRFPNQMNIRLKNKDGTDFNYMHNNPFVEWDAYPGAVNYMVVVLVEDRVPGGMDNEHNDRWDIAFSKIVNGTSVQVFSGKLDFVPVYSTGDLKPSETLNSGEVVRVEVYVLDGSPILDMGNKTGALYMSSLNLVVE